MNALPLLLTSVGPMLIVGFLVFLVYAQANAKRPEILLQEWASENGYRIATWEQRLFYKGPFFWSGRHSTVYHVTLENTAGCRATAFVRCTPQLWGWPANPVEIRWE